MYMETRRRHYFIPTSENQNKITSGSQHLEAIYGCTCSSAGTTAHGYLTLVEQGGNCRVGK